MDGDPATTDGLAARRVQRAVTRAGLHVFEAVYEPHSRLPDHEHASPFFSYVLRGAYAERAGGATRDCRRGAVIFHRDHESHANVVGPRGTASLNVELALDAWRELTDDVSPARRIAGRVLTDDVEWHAFAVWREFHRDDDGSALGMDEAVALLCDAVRDRRARGTFEPHRRLDACAEYLAGRLTGAVRLADVARIAGVHPMHLTRLFRRRFGCSMGEFVRRRRVAWACDQLVSGEGTISSVAARAGFSDHAHFTRTFRRLTGCSPRWYRERVRF
ncbi:Helix-turn-helix, AraC domain-containing protein (plasmid) [Gemmatirosa kalamazoonensis]|uniref:Helix-turn-helix, AraC domain-containing protein n=1 Tax=Gemmatirosa kalamazoonensis TaxID=861299 RepID=W0RUU3_9BACT|nr:AraC family transcriptional regulator [Gemmatirosa kalamazoonensis]AHG93353.1 Helix-turn-helix, AraC domain-containing protein [Gemmatirosa kalamazoonensis]